MFAVAPDVFGGIQLRSVGRQVLGVDAADRKSEPAESTKSSYPCGLRRCRNNCNSAGEASWGNCSDDNSLRVLKPGGKLISIPAHLRSETGNAPLELSNQEKSKTSARELFISFHESKRRPITRDYFSHRFWDHTPGCGSGLSIRIDQRGYGLCRKMDVRKAKSSSGWNRNRLASGEFIEIVGRTVFLSIVMLRTKRKTKLAGATGLEPPTSCVTGRNSYLKRLKRGEGADSGARP